MPDNFPLDPSTGPNAAPVATDEIGGVHYQVVKLAHGADGTATPASAAAPLPTADAATQATLSQLAAAVRAGDSAGVGSDPGVVMLARRQDADIATADTDGDYAALAVNPLGRLKVSAQPALAPQVVGDITAVGQTVSCLVERWSNVVMHMVAAGLSGHTSVFEGSIDSTDGTDGAWFSIQAVRSNANSVEINTGTAALAATPVYGWEMSTNGLRYIRVRATAHTGGTATWKMQAAPYATEPIPAVQSHSVTLTSTSLIPSTTGGLSTTHKLISGASTNATSAKAAAGVIALLIAANLSASARYLKFYNKASAPTVGTDTPVMTIPLQPNTTLSLPLAIAMRFTVGIAYALTGGVAAADTTAIGAEEVVINLLYV